MGDGFTPINTFMLLTVLSLTHRGIPFTAEPFITSTLRTIHVRMASRIYRAIKKGHDFKRLSQEFEKQYCIKMNTVGKQTSGVFE